VLYGFCFKMLLVINCVTVIGDLCFSSMTMNLLAFLADLFNVMEIHPAKCVCFPGSSQGNLSLKDRKYLVLSQNCSNEKLF
jgi:hypothetical protein